MIYGIMAKPGNFRLIRKEVSETTFSDFESPWNFYQLFLSKDLIVIRWLQNNGLLITKTSCDLCGAGVQLGNRGAALDGVVWRCAGRKRHEFSIRQNSFFTRSKIPIRDLLHFMYSFVNGDSLHRCSQNSGIDYKKTAVDWAKSCRQVCVEYVYEEVLGFSSGNRLVFSGHVEIDESVFGRRRKYNKGYTKGVKIWIVGLVERTSNRMILYPVERRDAKTLTKIIQRHVAPGSTIYTDSWSGYNSLNNLGYSHFTVVHKDRFVQEYEHVGTHEIIKVHTNQIEGGWKHAKDHFKRINGTTIANFESHLALVTFRNHHAKTNRFSSFFNKVVRYFPLDKPPHFKHTEPLFDTWQDAQDSSIHRLSDEDEFDDGDEVLPQLLAGPLPQTVTNRQRTQSLSYI